MIEDHYRAYADACTQLSAEGADAAATLSDFPDEEWMAHIVESLLEPLEQESEAVILPPSAQQWLDELPGLLTRRQMDPGR